MSNITAAASSCSSRLQRCTVYAFVFPIDQSHALMPIPIVTFTILITVLIISNYLFTPSSSSDEIIFMISRATRS